MQWQVSVEEVESDRCYRYTVSQQGTFLSFQQVVLLWRESDSFRSFFVKTLCDSPMEAYRWETPCLTSATFGRTFEFVLLRNSSLRRAADANAFVDHFSNEDLVVSFPNLGRDATLIVPCPRGDASIYCHLASFVRGASSEQSSELFRQVAIAVQLRVGVKPMWLNTAGMGVAWLHVRLDDGPKYYRHQPYRSTEAP